MSHAYVSWISTFCGPCFNFWSKKFVKYQTVRKLLAKAVVSIPHEHLNVSKISARWAPPSVGGPCFNFWSKKFVKIKMLEKICPKLYKCTSILNSN